MTQKTMVVLLFGGRSAEHEISLISAASIFKNLDRHKFDVISIYINKQGNWRIVESPLLAQTDMEKGPFLPFLPWTKKSLPDSVDADIYFPILHGPYGEDGTIQGLFEMADVPYVGATVLASAVGMDKAIAKSLFLQRNLPVVKHLVLLESTWKQSPDQILKQIQKDFPPPFFVKPSNLGSSVGITKVNEFRQTQTALEAAFQYDYKILVEEGIQGREIECSVLGNVHPHASLPGEIIPHREFYDYKDKYIEGKTSFGIPADLPQETVNQVQDLAVKAYLAIDCSGMARVDFFLQERTEKVFLSEINTIPGFTEISMYPKLWEVSGLPYSELLDELINLGFERHKNKKRKGVFLKP
jgi:D-alanine-D-alanine ligase